MSETVSLTIHHSLGREEARRRLEHGFQRVTEQTAGKSIRMDQHWTGDRMDFTAGIMGQTINGHLIVRDDAVDLEITLPRLLASMATMFKGRLRKQATALLEKK
ncbi:polyhydroxyalkanoic acid system family protein [Pararhizobium mangrovi]|uniref:Polyhydroxyalkanoic acid synthase n=1 Tax=Pararhizobium mangrovi TaxID=2590452 RepID=A0A506U887_9HYPH|nr:polyhydroxyalkanoic acid system family protein [Pararhizobium mangrovi]TPW29556.1 hypothetical protein FJU11_07560 [Pararhizobium mangrovi]